MTESNRIGVAADLDFMHFQAAGHAILADRLAAALDRAEARRRAVIFNSVTFLVYLAVMVSLYWVLPRRPRLWLLFLGSLAFYGFWRVEYMLPDVDSDGDRLRRRPRHPRDARTRGAAVST